MKFLKTDIKKIYGFVEAVNPDGLIGKVQGIKILRGKFKGVVFSIQSVKLVEGKHGVYPDILYRVHVHNDRDVKTPRFERLITRITNDILLDYAEGKYKGNIEYK